MTKQTFKELSHALQDAERPMPSGMEDSFYDTIAWDIENILWIGQLTGIYTIQKLFSGLDNPFISKYNCSEPRFTYPVSDAAWTECIESLRQTAFNCNRIKKVDEDFLLCFKLNSNYTKIEPITLFNQLLTTSGKDFLVKSISTVDNIDYGTQEGRAKVENTISSLALSLLDSKLPGFSNIGSPLEIELPINKDILQDSEFQEVFADWDETTITAFFDRVKTLRVLLPPKTQSDLTTPTYSRTFPKNEKGQPYTNLADVPDNQKEYFERSLLSMSTPLEVFLDIEISREEAQYLTNSEEPRPADLLTWSMQLIKSELMNVADSLWSINPLDRVRNVTDTLRPFKKTNELGLITTTDGEILYVPDVDNIDSYYESVQQRLTVNGDCTNIDVLMIPGNNRVAGDYSTGINELNERYNQIRATFEKQFPPNKMLFTDWTLDQLSYTNASGFMSQMSLIGCNPTSERAILKYLSSVYDSNICKGFLSFLDTCLANLGNDPVTFMKTEYFLPYLPNTVLTESSSLEDVVQIWASVYGSTMLISNLIESRSLSSMIPIIISLHNSIFNKVDNAKELYSDDLLKSVTSYTRIDDLLIRDFTSDSDCILLRIVGLAVDSLYKELFTDKGELELNNFVVEKRAVVNLLPMAASVVILQNYGSPSKYSALSAKVDELINKDACPTDIPNDYVPQEVPNLKEGCFYLPHQIKAEIGLDTIPDFSILAVDAGGGKTPICITDALKLLGKGKVKLPLVLCPKFLTKNYVEDIAFLSAGKVNSFVINTQIMNQYGEDTLKKMVDSLPPNTIIISDFDYFLKGRPIEISYGVQNLVISLNGEFMRSFPFDGVWIDESHKLANPNSLQTRSTQRIVSNIPIRRLATGTFINDTPMDAHGQMSLLDPGILGSRKEFSLKYGEEFRGEKVVLWKKGAESEIKTQVTKGCQYIAILRKEWRALLPDKNEAFHFVDMTNAQRTLYQTILKEAIEEIMSDPELAAKMASGDESIAAEIEYRLRPYLQRVEQFLTDPSGDDAGQLVLEGSNAIGPKCKKITEIIQNHVNDEIPGKILVFCSYIRSTRAIYEALPPQLQRKFILYEAAKKDQHIKQFATDPNIIGLIGVENSLNTGHNFQFVSRLIRNETIWTPGTLEQADARLNRPDPKNKYGKRESIYFDWVVVDRSIDVTKTSRLISKLIVAAKYQEAGNPLYDAIPSVPLVSMTIDSILEYNDFAENLQPYLDAYQQLQTANALDVKQYMSSYTGPTEPVLIPYSGLTLEGSAVTRVPFLSNHVIEDPQNSVISCYDYCQRENITLSELTFEKGSFVYSEYGPAKVVKSSKTRVTIDVKGIRHTVNKQQVFLYNKEGDNADVLSQLAHNISMPLDLPSPISLVEDHILQELEQEEPIQIKNGEIECYLGVMNNLVTVSISDDEADIPKSLIKSEKFVHMDEYLYAHIPTYRAMSRFVETLEGKFDIPQTLLNNLYSAVTAFKSGKRKLLDVKYSSQLELKNFYKAQKKAIPKGEVHPYVVIEDGELYVAFRLAKQPSARYLRRIKIPTVTWAKGGNEYVAFYQTKKEAQITVKKFQEVVTVSNLEDVKEMYNDIRVFKRKK